MGEWEPFDACATFSGRAKDFIRILIDHECPECGGPNFAEYTPQGLGAGISNHWSPVLLCVDCDYKWNGKYNWYRKKKK